jgi:hypothetical protein
MDEMVLVFKGYRVPVEMAKGILENNKIPCLMKSKHGAGFIMKTGGILEEYFLYVNPEDEEKAKELCMYLNEEKS